MNDGQQLRQAPNGVSQIDFTSAAVELGVSEQALQAALSKPGQGPPNFEAVAQQLGVTADALIEALGVPSPPRGGQPGGQPPTNQP